MKSKAQSKSQSGEGHSKQWNSMCKGPVTKRVQRRWGKLSRWRLIEGKGRQEEAEAGSARREDPGSDIIPKTVGNHSSGEWGAGAACDLQRVSTLQGRD